MKLCDSVVVGRVCGLGCEGLESGGKGRHRSRRDFGGSTEMAGPAHSPPVDGFAWGLSTGPASLDAGLNWTAHV